MALRGTEPESYITECTLVCEDKPARAGNNRVGVSWRLFSRRPVGWKGICIWVLGIGGWGSGFRVWGLGVGVRSFGGRVESFRFRV